MVQNWFSLPFLSPSEISYFNRSGEGKHVGWVLDDVGGTWMSQLNTNRVRDFRKNQTPSENTLWQMLRNRKLDGYKFYRQHPIKVMLEDKVRYYIADFYCYEKKLVIEIDGKVHDHQKEYDDYRTFLI
jgi:very-short-patch-repair endonuclease